jgi:hypothetical protein
MKMSKYIILILALLTVFSGCDDFLGDNRDPMELTRFR